MGISALMVLCMLVPCINGIDADIEVEQVYVEDTPVTVIGYQSTDNVPEALKQYSGSVSTEDEITADGEFYMVSGDALIDNSVLSDNFIQAAYNGSPAVIIGGNYEPLRTVGETLGMNVEVPEMQAYGMHYDVETDIQYIYAVSGFTDEAEATAEMYALMNTVSENSDQVLEGINGSKIFSFSYECGDFGKISGRTEYCSIEDSSDNYNFYMVHYRLQGLPYSGHSKSLLGVISDVDADPTYGQYQTLLEYGPTTSSGTSTVEFSAGVSAGFDGAPSVTANFQASWSYSLSDTTSVDHSDLDEEYFNVDYDINECTNAGYNTLLVEPGLVASVSMDGDGGYHVTDTYKAQFCNVVIHGAWHNTFTNFTYPVEVEMY